MEAVKVWSFSMCSAVVIGSIVTMIVPSIEKNKIIKLVISAFILAGVLSPLLSIINDVDISVSEIEQTLQTSDILSEYSADTVLTNNLEDNVAKSLFPLIEKQLSKHGIEDNFGVSVDLKYCSDGVSVESVNIGMMDSHIIRKEEIEKELEETLGLNIRLSFNYSGEKENE